MPFIQTFQGRFTSFQHLGTGTEARGWIQVLARRVCNRACCAPRGTETVNSAVRRVANSREGSPTSEVLFRTMRFVKLNISRDPRPRYLFGVYDTARLSCVGGHKRTRLFAK